MFESIMRDSIVKHLEKRKLATEAQLGVLKINLLVFIEVTNYLDLE